MSERDLGTYQMLWDCPFCETPGLLGVTHRHCPNCGAAQDPKRRYFPSDDQKVKLEDHRFTGADKVCANCGTPNGTACHNCANCGSSLEGARAAGTLDSRAVGAGRSGTLADAEKARKLAERQAASQPAEPPKRSGGRGCLILLGLVVLGIMGFFCLNAFWKKEASFEVTGHQWSRSVDIEVFGPDASEGWCDAMPSEAYDVSKSDKERSKNKVQDGEQCHTKQVDQGDGSFKEVEECTPKYREEPVMDDWCRYTVDRWKKAREEKAEGKSLGDAPRWPELRLRTGSDPGSEREGGRSETYTVLLKGPDGDAERCEVPEARWKGMAVGSHWKAKVAVLTGGVDCSALEPAK